jgi:Zn-dependent peptidase ImmA (M78 family)
MASKYQQAEISALGQYLACCHFVLVGSNAYPIDPEIIATKVFGVDIFPQRQLSSAGVRSGIDTTQSTIFIDYDIYMEESLQHLSRQSIAHELGHIIFDAPLLRRLATTNVDDAFELHEMIVKSNSGIEWTAHKLSGAFLVPRDAMLKQVAQRLYDNYDKVTGAYPQLTLGDIFQQMEASQLSRHFGVSEDVIKWRFKDEELHYDFRGNLDTPLRAINKKLIAQLADRDYRPQPLSERIKALLPEELPALFQQYSY